jgi:hypothetical protein
MNTKEKNQAILEAAEYYYNYCGQIIDIKTYNKGQVYCLWIDGGGYGSGSEYDGESRYILYKSDFPSGQLKAVGIAHTRTIGHECRTTINWYEEYIDWRRDLPVQSQVTLPGAADGIFCKIFKRKTDGE